MTTAIYLNEFAGPRMNIAIRLVIDMLNGVPTIVTAVFVYGLLVVGFGFSGLAAAVALSVIMLPLIARASLEALSRVPGTMREAAEALGVSHWRAVFGVILPGASRAIVTATILAAARAAGETAPVLITNSTFGPGYQFNPLKGMASIPMTIWTLIEYPQGEQQAWGAAFLLLVIILLANIGARTLIARAQRNS